MLTWIGKFKWLLPALLSAPLVLSGISACRKKKPDQVLQVRATITSMKGTVKIKRARSTNWISASVNMPVGVNDKISSDPGAWVTLEFKSGGTLHLDENSLIAIQDITHKRRVVGQQLAIDRGNVDINLMNAMGDMEFRIKTPSAETIVGKREITFQ